MYFYFDWKSFRFVSGSFELVGRSRLVLARFTRWEIFSKSAQKSRLVHRFYFPRGCWRNFLGLLLVLVKVLNPFQEIWFSYSSWGLVFVVRHGIGLKTMEVGQTGSRMTYRLFAHFSILFSMKSSLYQGLGRRSVYWHLFILKSQSQRYTVSA